MADDSGNEDPGFKFYNGSEEEDGCCEEDWDKNQDNCFQCILCLMVFCQACSEISMLKFCPKVKNIHSCKNCKQTFCFKCAKDIDLPISGGGKGGKHTGISFYVKENDEKVFEETFKEEMRKRKSLENSSSAANLKRMRRSVEPEEKPAPIQKSDRIIEMELENKKLELENQRTALKVELMREEARAKESAHYEQHVKSAEKAVQPSEAAQTAN